MSELHLDILKDQNCWWTTNSMTILLIFGAQEQCLQELYDYYLFLYLNFINLQSFLKKNLFSKELIITTN